VDPNFDRTVVYMLEHSDQGALGVVINRPSGQDTLPGLDAWIDASEAPRVVFSGGPVEPDGLIAVAWSASTGESTEGGWAVRRNGIGTVDLGREPYEVTPAPDRVRLFRGYSGWAPWQLDGELEAGAWIVLDAEVSDPFAPQPHRLWRDILRRQGGRLAWVAEAPDDLSTN
jgi:putative transcriptional regulator